MIRVRKFKGRDGEWYVTLHEQAGNREALFRTTDGYVDERDADRSIEILRENGLRVYETSDAAELTDTEKEADRNAAMGRDE